MARCPICETDNSDGAFDCATCGKSFANAADEVEDATPIDGLEQTIHDPLESGPDPGQLLPELEQTLLARRDLKIAVETVPGVEHTQIEPDPDAVVNWNPGKVDLDLGREPDDGQRTPAPTDDGTCPRCGEPATGAVCDNCGRRRFRYSAPAAERQARASGDTVLCPACFARVPTGVRCIECGVPFAVVEL